MSSNFSLFNPDDDDLPDNASAPDYAWLASFVHDEVRPFLVQHRQAVMDGLGRWQARREEQMGVLAEWQGRQNDYLRHLAAQPADPWDESEPVGEGWEWRESWRDPSDQVLYRIRNWLPPWLNQSRPSVDDPPLPPPRNRDLTLEECWAALVAEHDVVRVAGERFVPTFNSNFDALCRRTARLTDGYLPDLRAMLRTVMAAVPIAADLPPSLSDSAGAPTQPSAAPPAVDSAAGGSASRSAVATAADLADEVEVTRASMDSALRRFAKKHPDCRERLENPKPREPRYVYRRNAVQAVLDRFRRDGRTDGRNK